MRNNNQIQKIGQEVTIKDILKIFFLKLTKSIYNLVLKANVINKKLK